LANVTKQDILDLYNNSVHPSAPDRAKLSVHLHSRKPKPKQISEAAAQAFEEKVMAAGIMLADGIKDDEPGGTQMSVANFVEHWENVLGDDPQANDLLADIPVLANLHPATEEDIARRLEGPTYIQDVAQFRKGLRLSEDPKPIVEWGDLPVSKF
jgi:insulysin